MSLFDTKLFEIRSVNIPAIAKEINDKEPDPNKRKELREDRIEVDFSRIFKNIEIPKSSCKCFEITEEDFKTAFPKCEADTINMTPIQVSSRVEKMDIDRRPVEVPVARSSSSIQPPITRSEPTFKVPERITTSVTISDEEMEEDPVLKTDFKSALEVHELNTKKNNNNSLTLKPPRRIGLSAPFRPPVEKSDPPQPSSASSSRNSKPNEAEKLKGLDMELVEKIETSASSTDIAKYTWDDISGLEYPKSVIQETVVLPQLRPDLFTGLRRPPKGILLFGPPGTGKTLIGKCIASQSNSKFYSISASILTSKWIGEGEKLVRTLFAVATANQPSVIFIDEIDSLLSKRSEKENEGSRRMKTEFMTSMDGATTKDDDRVLIIGATNRPQELDDAIRRRFVKRLYIPLPDEEARCAMLQRLLTKESHSLTQDQLRTIARLTDTYSGSDIKELAKEAAFQAIRGLTRTQLQNVQKNEVRPVNMSDFEMALRRVKPTVDQNDLEEYVQWDKTFGCGAH